MEMGAVEMAAVGEMAAEGAMVVEAVTGVAVGDDGGAREILGPVQKLCSQTGSPAEAQGPELGSLMPLPLLETDARSCSIYREDW